VRFRYSSVLFRGWLYSWRIAPDIVDRSIIKLLEDDICSVFDDGVD
jgi:hypothetical protein